MNGMARTDFERLVVDWLDETARAGAPDYLDEVLARIEHVNQRPAWLSPGRWLPMRALTLRRFEVPRFVPYLVALALLLLLAVAIALVAGSQRRLPPPFGLAAPGVLVLDAGGDLVGIDVSGKTVGGFARTPTREFGATWSRDGLHVAYWSTAVTNPGGERTPATLWVADADGSNARAVLADRQFETYELLPSVSWSPDSRQLAFSTTSGELFVVDVTGTNLHTIGNDSMGRCCPAWSPDGSLIAYNTGSNASAVSFPTGHENLYVARPDGTGETRVNRDPVGLPVPDWSSDGSLAFVAGPGDVVVATRAAGGWTNRTVFAGEIENFFPRWSNSGDRLAFVRGSLLWVIGADGSDARRIRTRDWVNIAAPCWSPDDRVLVALHTDLPDALVEFQESASALFVDVAADEQIAKVPVPRISAILACSWQRLAP